MKQTPQNKNRPQKKIKSQHIVAVDRDERRKDIAKWTLAFIERYRSDLEALAKK